MDDLIHHEFTVGLPGGWQDMTEVIFVGPARDGSSPTLTIKRVPLKVEQTLEQFVGFQRHGLGTLLGVKKLDIVEEGALKLGDLDAYMFVYHFRFDDKRLKQRQIYALRGRMAYVVTETSTVEHYADDRPTFEEIMKRFEFRLPAA